MENFFSFAAGVIVVLVLVIVFSTRMYNARAAKAVQFHGQSEEHYRHLKPMGDPFVDLDVERWVIFDEFGLQPTPQRYQLYRCCKCNEYVTYALDDSGRPIGLPNAAWIEIKKNQPRGSVNCYA